MRTKKIIAELDKFKTMSTEQPNTVFIAGIEVPTYKKISDIRRATDYKIKGMNVKLKIISFACLLQTIAIVMIALKQLH